MDCKYAKRTPYEWPCGCEHTLATIVQCRNPKRQDVTQLSYDQAGFNTRSTDNVDGDDYVIVRSFECSSAYCNDFEEEDASFWRKFDEYKEEK